MSPPDETLEAYEHWAPVYPPIAHNPLMQVEQQAMHAAWPDMAGRRVLDLACGSGRYSRMLLDSHASQVISLDFCMPMLSQIAGQGRVCASMMRLPFKQDSFDGVVSGLALGHATGLTQWMEEAARVLRPGGTLLYSDFHPAAARAGLTRSFKDANQVSRTVPHRVYEVEAQLQAAAAAGLKMEVLREIRVGEELQEWHLGSESAYRRLQGLPIVLVVRAVK